MSMYILAFNTVAGRKILDREIRERNLKTDSHIGLLGCDTML